MLWKLERLERAVSMEVRSLGSDFYASGTCWARIGEVVKLRA